LVKGSVSLCKTDCNKELVRLKPGELAICQKSSMNIDVDTVDTDLYTSWRHGQFKFKELSFEEISKRLSRNFNIQFVFLNKNLQKIRYNGSFYNYESLDQILHIMKTNSPFLFKIKKDTVIIK
jgi:ferric-dicitrate binding protein FerR (iron transport regulator)